MSSRVFLPAVLAALLLGSAASPGSAATPPVSQSLTWPYPPGTQLVMEAPDSAWGIRASAAYIDDRVGGLRIHRTRGLSCASNPRLPCVVLRVVEVGPGMPPGWTDVDSAGRRTVHLNSTWYVGNAQARRETATHELCHVLGFVHHTGGGCQGVTGIGADPSYHALTPNAAEMALLRHHYGQ